VLARGRRWRLPADFDSLRGRRHDRFAKPCGAHLEWLFLEFKDTNR
jgi:hypothetical protein